MYQGDSSDAKAFEVSEWKLFVFVLEVAGVESKGSRVTTSCTFKSAFDARLSIEGMMKESMTKDHPVVQATVIEVGYVEAIHHGVVINPEMK